MTIEPKAFLTQDSGAATIGASERGYLGDWGSQARRWLRGGVWFFAPVAFRNWSTGQACSPLSTSPARFYLEASKLFPMRPQADVVAELQAQGLVPPFTLVVR